MTGPSDSFHLLNAQPLALKGPRKGQGLFKTQSYGFVFGSIVRDAVLYVIYAE